MSEMNETSTPACVGIIIDGNRRWARARGKSTSEGHAQGLERLIETVRWVHARGIPHVVAYMLSTENLKRSPEEVAYLMELIERQFMKHVDELGRENIRFRVVGERSVFKQSIQDIFTDVEKRTEHNTGTTVWACLGYGGRAEIMRAANHAREGGEITEETFAKNLWTAGMPDPDLIIRTGGEKRLSGFMTWQSIYSELFFIDEMWPDFSEKILDRVLDAYAVRERRHGK